MVKTIETIELHDDIAQSVILLKITKTEQEMDICNTENHKEKPKEIKEKPKEKTKEKSKGNGISAARFFGNVESLSDDDLRDELRDISKSDD